MLFVPFNEMDPILASQVHRQTIYGRGPIVCVEAKDAPRAFSGAQVSAAQPVGDLVLDFRLERDIVAGIAWPLEQVLIKVLE